MFYMASKVSEDRVKVVTYGRIVYMTNAEYERWEASMAWRKNNN